MEQHHHTGKTLDVVGIQKGSSGRSCEDHPVCGSVIDLDHVLRLRSIEILNGMAANITDMYTAISKVAG